MNKKEDFCVTENYTIKEVIEVLERIKERGVVVIGETGKVCGVLSQGDIVKALAGGKNIYSPISKAFSTSFIFLNKVDIKRAFEMFKTKNLSIIPIINDNNELVQVLTARELLKYASFREN